MNNINQPAFSPEHGKTVNITASVASANILVRSNASARERHCRVWNSGTVPAFIRFGADNSVTASTTTDLPIPPGAVEVLGMSGDWAAAVTPSGTAVVYFAPGEGL